MNILIEQKEHVFKNIKPTMIDLIKYPVLNYKSYILLTKYQQYMFDVDIRLTKPQIKKLLEAYFTINILKIHTHIPPRKKRRYTAIPGYQNRYKRVLIHLKKDEKFPYFEQLMAGFLKQLKSAPSQSSTPSKKNEK